MSNPFVKPGSLLVEKERKRREQFKVGVYASLAAMLCLLAGLLIQGCHNDHGTTTADSSSSTSDSAATNSQPAATDATLPPATNEVTSASSNTVAPPAVSAPTPQPPVAPTIAAPETTPTTPTALTNTPAKKTASAKGSLYIVKTGDSLTRIAKAHGISVKALKAANKLKSDSITVGRKLVIPQVKKNATAPARD